MGAMEKLVKRRKKLINTLTFFFFIIYLYRINEKLLNISVKFSLEIVGIFASLF